MALVMAMVAPTAGVKRRGALARLLRGGRGRLRDREGSGWGEELVSRGRTRRQGYVGLDLQGAGCQP
jgi:hypothetical protein